MAAIPTIATERLCLRPFDLDDAPRVQQLAGEREIAATTILVPHPYPDGAAQEWIGRHAALFAEGRELSLAVTLADAGTLTGAVSLRLDRDHGHGELGYWIGKPYWGRGYATEAAGALVRYGFESLGLHRVHAHHMAGNRASGRVLEKIGLRLEGRLREHVCKWGEHMDLAWYGLLKSDWDMGRDMKETP